MAVAHPGDVSAEGCRVSYRRKARPLVWLGPDAAESLCGGFTSTFELVDLLEVLHSHLTQGELRHAILYHRDSSPKPFDFPCLLGPLKGLCLFYLMAKAAYVRTFLPPIQRILRGVDVDRSPTVPHEGRVAKEFKKAFIALADPGGRTGECYGHGVLPNMHRLLTVLKDLIRIGKNVISDTSNQGAWKYWRPKGKAERGEKKGSRGKTRRRRRIIGKRNLVGEPAVKRREKMRNGKTGSEKRREGAQRIPRPRPEPEPDAARVLVSEKKEVPQLPGSGVRGFRGVTRK